MIFPVANGRITQRFSSRHRGWDIAPSVPGKHESCLAPEDSVVYTTGYRPSLEGNYVILKGKSGRYWYFGHFYKVNVQTGERVKAGKPFALLGRTGSATGVHTHMEIRPTPVPANQINPSSIKWEEDMVDGKTAAQWKAERDKYRNAWKEEQKQREKYRKAWKVESSRRYKAEEALKKCQGGK